MPEREKTPCLHCGGIGTIMVSAPSYWTGGRPQISGTASVRCQMCQGSGVQPPRYRVAHTMSEDATALECWTDTLEHACALAQALCQTYGGSIDIADQAGRPVSCTELLSRRDRSD